MPLTQADRSRVLLAASIIEQSAKFHFTIPQLADKVEMPEKKLKTMFKQVFGVGLYTYLRNYRLNKAKEMLLEGKCIQMTMHNVGYKSESNFCSAFHDVHGETPGAFVKRWLSCAG